MRTKNHTKIIFTLGLIAICMFGFGFALVPIYNTICKNLNINGKVNLTPAKIPNQDNVNSQKTHEVIVQFIATNNREVPWLFFPKVKQVKLHPGEVTKLSFYAENQTNKSMTVQAIPSVTPGVAAQYIKKTECFCFTQQTLDAHEAMDMPLIFHLDANLPEKITTITLAYTLFDVTPKNKGA